MAHFSLTLNNSPLSDCHSLLTRSPAERRLACFQALAVMNKAGASTRGQAFVWM
jgi:hypothetical protein